MKERFCYGIKRLIIMFAIIVCCVCLGTPFSVMATPGSEGKRIEIGKEESVTSDQSHPVTEFTLQTTDYAFSYQIEVMVERALKQNMSLKVPTITVYDSTGKVIAEQSEWENVEDSSFCLLTPVCQPGRQYNIKISFEGTYKLYVTKDNTYGKIRLAKRSAVYNGKKIKLPQVTVYDAAGKKIDSGDYKYWFATKEEERTYSYDKTFKKQTYVKNAGDYALFIRYDSGKGYASADEKLYYDIETQEEIYNVFNQKIEHAFVVKPERAVINSQGSENGTITVNCKKSSNAQKYVWQLATDKKCKHIVKKGTSGTKTQKVFKKLNKGKTYYARVCIETSDAVRGAYSKPVKVKCK